MLTYHLRDIFSIMLERNLNMTILKCFENVMCLQGYEPFQYTVAENKGTCSGHYTCWVQSEPGIVHREWGL